MYRTTCIRRVSRALAAPHTWPLRRNVHTTLPCLEEVKAIKRFWKAAGIRQQDGETQVLLDSRQLKTPGGLPCRLANEHTAGALVIAGEWESVRGQLKAHSIAATSVAARAIDALSDPKECAQTIDRLVPFLHRDTLCYQQDRPHSLVQLQKEHWDPLLAWARQRYQVELTVTDSIIGIQQPDATVKRLREEVVALSPLKLAAFEQIVIAAKSFIIALAVLERRINVQQAVDAAQLEVLSQIGHWGMVEDGHDLDFERTHQQIGAAASILIR